MDYKDWIPILEGEMHIEYDKAPKEKHSSAHQLDHIERVWKRAEKLGRRLGADMEILVAAVYLHDIGRQYGLELHGPESAKHAKDALERMAFPEEKRGAVLEAIAKHDYQTPDSERKSPEAKILYDCDKMDAFGDAGIKRYEEFYLRPGKKTMREIIENIDLRFDTLALPESKELAKADYLKVRGHFEALL